jgi:hypothetical protein
VGDGVIGRNVGDCCNVVDLLDGQIVTISACAMQGSRSWGLDYLVFGIYAYGKWRWAI